MANSPKTSIIEKMAPVLIVLSIALAFIVGVLWQKVQNLEKGVGTPTANTATQVATIDIKTIKGLWDKDLLKFGDANKKVLFVEILDPSCPYCHVAGGYDPEIAAEIDARFEYVTAGGPYTPPVPEMEKLVKEGRASMAIIYFPGHGNGEMAMKALYCANDQGKFWEAHSLIMTNAGYELQNTTVKNDKAQSGKVADFLKSVVNATDLKACLDSGKYDSRLSNDQDIANTLDVSGTPGFFINSSRFDGAYSYKDMQSVVDAALK